jgi:hypothetical protein
VSWSNSSEDRGLLIAVLFCEDDGRGRKLLALLKETFTETISSGRHNGLIGRSLFEPKE